MFDVHVHAAPDVMDRIGYDDQICAEYAAAGFSGFVLKGHQESTVGRARALARASGLDVVGGIALNRPAGGINPSSVAATLQSGGRVIWFPTADAHTQEAAGLPRLSDLQPRLNRSTLSTPPVLAATEQQLDDIALVLDLIAEFDAVLCTGHLSGDECRWLFEQARSRNITRFLLTHPSYTVPAMGISEIADFAAQGAYVEITAYQLWHQPEMTNALLAEVARAAGDKLILASDAGQPTSPQPPRALRELIETLAGLGLDRSWLEASASDNPRELVLS
ncbi:hypothetical protein BJ994_002807 [Arthrobacter pigmenti]|uniref:Amidohydrolase-related domain-containing protein n=1 Tax=Arthrobacter pigmenti TaxID=271432 RepID=A0A846RZX9_9MICC|nr:hypothetical protein [Arthrobacter pigmenti]